MCILAKKQYPEVLRPPFISLSSCTNKECSESHLLTFAATLTEHIQLHCSEEQIKYASLAGHT